MSVRNGVTILRSKTKKPVNVEVGKNIKYYREHKEYSREKLAELSGVSPRFIADVESGVVGVSISTLKSICTILGVSADRILWGNNTTKPSLDEQVSHLNPKHIEIISQLVQKQIELIAEVTNSTSSTD